MTLDDVPIGLALQEGTPFRFACQRLWVEHISDVCLPLNVLNRVLEPRVSMITSTLDALNILVE